MSLMKKVSPNSYKLWSLAQFLILFFGFCFGLHSLLLGTYPGITDCAAATPEVRFNFSSCAALIFMCLAQMATFHRSSDWFPSFCFGAVLLDIPIMILHAIFLPDPTCALLSLCLLGSAAIELGLMTPNFAVSSGKLSAPSAKMPLCAVMAIIMLMPTILAIHNVIYICRIDTRPWSLTGNKQQAMRVFFSLSDPVSVEHVGYMSRLPVQGGVELVPVPSVPEDLQIAARIAASGQERKQDIVGMIKKAAEDAQKRENVPPFHVYLATHFRLWLNKAIFMRTGNMSPSAVGKKPLFLVSQPL